MEENRNLAMISFSFYPSEHIYRHDTNLMFSVDDDMGLEEFHRLCKRFALTLGFSEKGINEVFGETFD